MTQVIAHLFRITLLAYLGMWMSGCGDFIPPEEFHIKVNLKDTETRQILDWQDRGAGDSLVQYFDHPKATFRYLAAHAFASIGEIRDVRLLAKLLEDPVDSVRMAAAYALGQIGDSTAAPLLASAFDTSHDYLNSKYAILEAVGKCAPASYLDYLTGVENYTPEREKPVKGLAWGIYRFGLRGITSRDATEKMVGLLTDPAYSDQARFIAAYYLARSAEGLDQVVPQELIRVFREEPDERIRMALARVLGKNGSPESLQALIERWSEEKDYRVRCNILRALASFEQPEAYVLAQSGLSDAHPAVSQQAATFFLTNGSYRGAFQYWRWSRDSFPIQTRSILAQATLRHLPFSRDTARRTFSSWLRREFARAEDPYRKIAWAQALAEEVWNYRFLHRVSVQEEHPAVRTAGMAGLRSIATRPDFDRVFGVGRRRVERELMIYFMRAIRSDDAGLVSEAANALRAPDRNFKTLLADSTAQMKRILTELTLPAQLEPYLELERTIRYIEGKAESADLPVGFNHPIDWNRMLIRIPQSAVVRTSRGDISLELFPEVAPGSVINFVNLAEMEFYDDLTFHRVVPNFVIQGGCPRGDGYGSLDYSIRSELGYLHYDGEGMLGMASAGKHTEGTQFFITHSPTPHLDGNYTLFGRVTEGMEVVHRIQQGDQILSIDIE